MDRTASSSGCWIFGTRSVSRGRPCSGAGWPRSSRRYPERLGRLVLVDAHGLQVDGALAAEFALTAPMPRPLVFAEPEAVLAREWLPDAEPPERVESALHARVVVLPGPTTTGSKSRTDSPRRSSAGRG
jgi:hypothetical protein